VKTGLCDLTEIIIKIFQKRVDGKFSITIMRTSSLTGSFSGQPFFKNKRTTDECRYLVFGKFLYLSGYGDDFKKYSSTYAKSKQIMQVIYFE
jgi:hypothetical protein